MSDKKLRFFLVIACLLLSPQLINHAQAQVQQNRDHFKKATFAGGCFWCMEADFEKIDGVIQAISGFSGGHQANPTYKQVSTGGTGHTEVVQISYDARKVSFQKLLDIYWHNTDPTKSDRQFCDTGRQYRPVIFTHDDTQQLLAEQSMARLMQSKPFKDPIVTEIVPLGKFYPAEEYHQDYYKKNPLRYKYYRHSCGRDKRLKELWGQEKR